MDLVTKELVAVAAYNVCQQIQADSSIVPAWTDVALIIGTASVETGFMVPVTNHGLGVFGLPIEGALRIYKTFEHTEVFRWFFCKQNKSAKQMWSMFSKAWLGISNVPWIDISKQDLRYLLTHDIRFAAAMCRWYYLSYLEEQPENISEVARMWAVFYRNDPEREVIRIPRTAQDFSKAWTKNDCMELMYLVGYQ